jgi:hypothetical protein
MPDYDNHALADRLLTFHPAERGGALAEDMSAVREKFIELGHLIVDRLPDGPDQTVAIRKLHEACMAAIAGIACNQD